LRSSKVLLSVRGQSLTLVIESVIETDCHSRNILSFWVLQFCEMENSRLYFKQWKNTHTIV